MAVEIPFNRAPDFPPGWYCGRVLAASCGEIQLHQKNRVAGTATAIVKSSSGTPMRQ
jgi:hypothetical protein